MKFLDDLKREPRDLFRLARERREERQARERRDGPILAAYDRLAAASAPPLRVVTEPVMIEGVDLGGEA